uniref:Uncharacterized protein n=1 Tax=Physcomitrium patens TaxID=3218 RepID=A0A2K1KL87_PHYPA|nr:hypothetical protein PHYPA_008217 [Physcomitrium patens]
MIFKTSDIQMHGSSPHLEARSPSNTGVTTFSRTFKDDNHMPRFFPVGLVALNLEICPHLVTLEMEATQTTTLDFCGCGALSQASI